MAISRQLIELMGGTIGFESEPGRGSSFWIEFALPRGGSCPSGDAPAIPAGRRVLVVDDNATNREILRRQLAGFGLEVEVLAEAREALACLRAAHGSGRPFDLVLLDWHMPGMGGLELAAVIRADASLAGLSLVMLSPAAATGGMREIAAVGFAAFLAKPVRVAQLRRCLAGILDKQTLASGTRPAGPATGTAVEVVGDGRQALERLARPHEFDAILMDCQMPDIDGYAATRIIREGGVPGLDRQIPIIALTAFAMADDRLKCIQAGMTDYVAKPVRLDDLVQVFFRCGLVAGQA